MKKIFKVIIASVLVICLGVGGFFGYRFYKSKNAGDKDTAENTGNDGQNGEMTEIAFVPVSEEDALSEVQWMELLNTAFEFTDYTEYSDDKINGTYAITTGFSRLGGACTEYYLDGKDKNEKNITAIAVERGLLAKEYLDSYIGQEQAEEFIENLKTLLQEDYHIEKNEVNLADGVVDGQAWSVDYYNHVENDEAENPVQDEVIAITGDYEPQVDDKIVYLDEYGIMHGGQIIAVQSTDDGKYDILTVPVETQDDLIDNYTIAGYVDWSKITNTNSGDVASAFTVCDTTSGDNTRKISTDMIISGECGTDGLEITSFIIENHDFLSDDDTQEDDMFEDDDLQEDDEEDSNEENFEASLSSNFKITLSDVQIYAYVEDDEEAYFDISFDPNVVLDGISVGAKLPLPSIPVGLGVLSAEINTTLIVDADMGITIEIGAENPVSISTKNDTIGGSVRSNDNSVVCNIDEGRLIDISADEFSISGGVQLGVALNLCEFIKVAEPNITTKMVAVGKQLEKVEGYEMSCYELKVAGPLLEISLTSEGTLLDYFLAKTDLPSTWSPTDFNDDSTLLFSKYYHLEFSPTKVLEDENGNASVCTHYSKDEDHSSDEKIQFSYGSDYSYDEDADYFIEINGEIFGFKFTNEEYEQQYLDYLDNISKEDIMGTNRQFGESDYVVNNAEYFQLPYEEMNNYNMIMPDQLCVIHGDDISNIRIARFISSVFGVAYLNSGYVYGDVVGSITYDDTSRYEDTLLNIGNNTFSFRRPYKNMEKTQEAE